MQLCFDSGIANNQVAATFFFLSFFIICILYTPGLQPYIQFMHQFAAKNQRSNHCYNQAGLAHNTAPSVRTAGTSARPGRCPAG